MMLRNLLINIKLLRENLEFDYRRILSGSLILIVLVSFYFLRIDIVLLSLICSFCLYDLYRSKIIHSSVLIFTFVISIILIYLLIFNRFIFQDISLIILFISSILLTILFRYKKNLFFCLSLIIFLYFFIKICLFDRNLFYFIILTSFLNDTSAYISGKIFKGPLIIPSISPKKTWSGTSISIFISTSFIYYFYTNLIFAFILSILFFFGDIYFSFIKRINNIKDFSNLFPGHGGILDRIDSMFFTTIIFFTYTKFLS